MSFFHRIRTIYRKELIDILRDRRTLIAMIAVPIVLYPLLLLGSVQAVSHQAESLQQELVVFGVTNEKQKSIVEQLIEMDRQALAKEHGDESSAAPPAASKHSLLNPTDRHTRAAVKADDDAAPHPISDYRVVVLGTADSIAGAVRERSINVGIIFDRDFLIDDLATRNEVKLLADMEEARSQFAHMRITELLYRTQGRITNMRKAAAGLPVTFDRPFDLATEDLSAPPSILGQVLPLILVLMTITGAIYPAIDLTAGERERGTLESLMVCPVAVLDLIVGKFLVVTTVAIMGATLNLASVSATVYFGGFNQVISTTSGGVPILQMLLILLCLVPFAVLMSAIMIAVCAYARTFKEAQNYVTPVIIAVLLPGGMAAMPATRLEGVMLVMPVGNMVLLARELLIGASVSWLQVAMVLCSTTLYATAAVGIAARVFGTEAVVFSDSGSLKAAFSRRFMPPRSAPPASLSLSVVALFFPLWFFIQTAMSPVPGEGAAKLLRGTAIVMPLVFVLLPVFILWYWKIDVKKSLALRLPAPRYLLGALLIGFSSWVPSHQLYALQNLALHTPPDMLKKLGEFEEAMRSVNPWMAIAVLAALPAVCEELFFRGLLLSGLRTATGKWTAIISSAAIFAVYHFLLIKFIPTAVLGLVLGYLFWQSRSIVPGMIVHLLHNGLLVSSSYWAWQTRLGVPSEMEFLPATVAVIGCAVFALGLWLVSRPGSAGDSRILERPTVFAFEPASKVHQPVGEAGARGADPWERIPIGVVARKDSRTSE